MPGVRIAVVAFEGLKRGIRLDVAFGEESPAGNFRSCFQIADGSVGEVISLSGDTATHALAQPTFRPSAFYRHRALQVKVTRTYSSHSGPQETNPSWNATATVGWTLDLKPIR